MLLIQATGMVADEPESIAHKQLLNDGNKNKITMTSWNSASLSSISSDARFCNFNQRKKVD